MLTRLAATQVKAVDWYLQQVKVSNSFHVHIHEENLIFEKVKFRYAYMNSTKAEFLDVFGTKVLRVFLLAIHYHLY